MKKLLGIIVLGLLIFWTTNTKAGEDLQKLKHKGTGNLLYNVYVNDWNKFVDAINDEFVFESCKHFTGDKFLLDTYNCRYDVWINLIKKHKVNVGDIPEIIYENYKIVWHFSKKISRKILWGTKFDLKEADAYVDSVEMRRNKDLYEEIKRVATLENKKYYAKIKKKEQ